MFEVFSKMLNDTISANSVQNYHDTFLCPNPNCTAEFSLRAANSLGISAHFACKPNYPHTADCIFGMIGGEKPNVSEYIKYDLMDILNPTSKSNHNLKTYHSSILAMNTNSVKYIRTPKQLLRYCLANRLTTEYTNGLTIGDIILDSRNLLINAHYRGVQGIRLIVGQTVKYCKEDKYIQIEVSTRTNTNKHIRLFANVYLPIEQIKEINNYFFNTEPKVFRNHPIAVLGEWKKEHDYHISCSVVKKENVIYRFLQVK